MSQPHSSNLRDPDNALSSLLTPREYEIAQLLAEGLSNEQIGERLVLVPGTVANHVAHILFKLQVDSRVQVAVKVAVHKSRMQSAAVLSLLAALRELKQATLRDTLQHATDVLATTFAADKVDAFLVDPTHTLLVAVGTSHTPMGTLQRKLALDRLPLDNGGRTVWVFRQAQPFLDGHVEADHMELRGLREGLGIRSSMAVPLEVSERTRGVLLVSSEKPEHFSAAQLQLLQFVSYWIGLVAREQESAEIADDPG